MTAPRRSIVVGRRLAERLALPMTLAVIWELCSRAGIFDPQFFPAPSQVASTFWTWVFGPTGAAHGIYSGNWIDHASASTRRVTIGFLIAAAIGIPVGVLIGWYRIAENLLDPLIQITRPIPMTAWVPFAVIIFGIQEPASISLIALGSFYPIVLNSAAGAERTPKVLVRAAQMLGMSEARLLPKVVVPSALPSILIGLRLGIGIAWVLVIVSEMLAVKSGLGYVLWDAYYFLRMDIIIAAMISVGFLGYLSDRALLAFGNYALRWSRGIYEGR